MQFLVLCVAVLSLGQLMPTPELPFFITPSGTYIDSVSVFFAVPAPYQSDVVLLGFNTTNVNIMNPAESPTKVDLSITGVTTGTMRIFLRAQRAGFDPSSAVSQDFIIVQDLNLFPPQVSLSQGAGATTITVTPGGTSFFIESRYELDTGTPVTYSSPVYSGPIVVTTLGPRTISVADTKIFRNGSQNISSTVTRAFVVSQAVPPIITPADGLYFTNNLLASVSCGAVECSLFYTIDGSAPVVVFSGLVPSPGSPATLSYTSAVTFSPGIRKLSAVAVNGGSASPAVFSNFQVTGLLAPPSFSPASGSLLSGSSAVSIASRDAANIWYMIQPLSGARPPPAVFPGPEWALLLQPNVSLASSSTLFVALDKLYFVPVVNISSAVYSVPAQSGTAVVVGAGFNFLWLLVLLALVPVAGVLVAAVLYRQKRKREAIENSIFRDHGFEFAPGD